MFVKTVKKALAFMIMATLVLTSFSFGVTANAAALDNILSGTEDFAVTSATDSSTVSKVINVKDKAADDYVYSLVATGGSAYPQFTATNTNGTCEQYLEFQFMLPEGSKGITFRTQQMYYQKSNDEYKGNSRITVTVSPDGISHSAYSTGAMPISNTAFETGKWYTLGLDFPGRSDDGSGNISYPDEVLKIYINGELAATSMFKYNEDYSYAHGYIRQLQFYPVNNVASQTPYIYMDNIIFGAGAYPVAKDASPSLSVADSSVISAIGEGAFTLAKSATVAEATAAVTKAADTNLRFYDLSGNLLGDNDKIPAGAKVVAAASNGTGMERTFSYYKVGKAEIKLNGTIYDGSTEIADGTQTTVEIVDGTFGKTDKVYAFSSVANGKISSTAGYHPEPFAIIQSGDASQKVLEFAFMLPNGSTGLGLTAHQWQGGASSGNPEHTIKISTTGIRIEYQDPSILNYKFDYDKWYNVAIVLPGKTEDNGYNYRATLYVNGKNAGVFPMVDTIGIRRLRIHALSTTDTENVFAYIDNLRMTDSGYLNGAYDAEDTIVTSVFNVDGGKDKFYVTQDTTAQAILNDVTELNEDSTVSVLNASGNTLTGDAAVTEGCTVVVASKGGTNLVRTVSYYDIENIAGKFVIITPEITDAENTAAAAVTAINNTNDAQSFSAIFAEYGETLFECVPVTCTVPAGEKLTFTDGISIDYTGENIVRFFIWKNTTDDITPLMEDFRIR